MMKNLIPFVFLLFAGAVLNAQIDSRATYGSGHGALPAAGAVSQPESPLRTWTDTQGREIQARLLGFDGDRIRIERDDGRRFTLGVERLSEGDRDYVEEAREARSRRAQAILEERPREVMVVIRKVKETPKRSDLWTRPHESCSALWRWPHDRCRCEREAGGLWRRPGR